MLATLLLSSIAAATPVERFHARFPSSVRIGSVDGQRLVHASGFAQPVPGIPEAAARTFLAVYGSAFGVTGRQSLVLAGAPRPGQTGAVHFQRTIDGLPVFGGNLVVGVDARGNVFAVNGADVPEAISGRHSLGEAASLRAAVAGYPTGVQGMGTATVVAGWRAAGDEVRAVYRVDFIARSPAGDWRVFVDAGTGSTLFREDRRRHVEATGSVFEISPVETLAAACPFAGAAHSFCANPVTVPFHNLVTGADLAGTQAQVFNCKGLDSPAFATDLSTVCSRVTAAAGGFGFPVDTTFAGTSDDFAAAMAYFHVDKHVSLFKRIDPDPPPAGGGRALVGSLPVLVNVQSGGGPFENAFFSPGLDALVFGQGQFADYAYDATVAYHELTHGVVAAWGDFNPAFDAMGAIDESGAVNEGTADAMAAAETGRSQIGSFVVARGSPPQAFVRDMDDPTASRTCQGDGRQVPKFGTFSSTGLDGEVHDDGEIWNGLAWEVFHGLRAAGVKGCDGACEAGPALQYKAIELAGGTAPTLNSYWQTMKAAASAVFPGNPDVAAYVDCVGQRRKFDKCDRTVPVYLNETKLAFVRLRYTTFQMVLNVTLSPARFNLCSANGTVSTVHLRKDRPVRLSNVNPLTGVATVEADFSLRLARRCTAGQTTFVLTSLGPWYILIESPGALAGGAPGRDLYVLTPGPIGIAPRPAAVAAPVCDTPSSLAISSPSPAVPPQGRLDLVASGGSGSGYAWSLATNASGGSIDAATGVYQAGLAPEVTDLVELTDDAGNIRTRPITIEPGITVLPGDAAAEAGEKIRFTVSGGSGTGFAWTFRNNFSGGNIDAATGEYTAGQTALVTDAIHVVDSLGNAANVAVAVRPPGAPGGGCATGGPGWLVPVFALAALLLRRRRL